MISFCPIRLALPQSQKDRTVLPDSGSLAQYRLPPTTALLIDEAINSLLNKLAFFLPGALCDSSQFISLTCCQGYLCSYHTVPQYFIHPPYTSFLSLIKANEAVAEPSCEKDLSSVTTFVRYRPAQLDFWSLMGSDLPEGFFCLSKAKGCPFRFFYQFL